MSVASNKPAANNALAVQSGLLRLFLPPKMNTKATKAAYQRRHGMAPRRPSSEEPNEEEQDEVQRQLRKHIKRTLFNEEPGIEKLSTKDAYLRRMDCCTTRALQRQ